MRSAGDSEALIRALTKLHAFARLPRRWDTEFERHATHPSLARRIQAIHAAAGTPPASLGEAATFAGADGASSVTFHDDRLQWNEGPSMSDTIDYGQVTMLRVDARRSGAATARRRGCPRTAGGRSSCDRATSHARRRRSTSSTHAWPRRPPQPVVSLVLARVLALMALLAALPIAQFTVALLGWIAVLRPAAAVTAAAGAASAGAAALYLARSL